MRTAQLSVWFCFISMAPAAASALEPTRTSLVLLKDPTVNATDRFEGGNKQLLKGAVFTVVEVREKRILIRDANQKELWVAADDLLALHEALTHYFVLIRSEKSVAWAWVQRGIVWEIKGELVLAVRDYSKAIEFERRM